MNCASNCEADGYTVKGFWAESLREPLGEFHLARIRISYYLKGCFGRGARFMLWDHRKFSRATQSKKPLSAKHIARVWVVFVRTSPNWRFQKIRIGRSFRWKVIPPARPGEGGQVQDGVTDLEVRSRLVGYIMGAARRQGTVKVGGQFLSAFCKTTAVPPPRARAAARQIRQIRGFSVRAREGVNGGFKLRVSLPHFSDRIGSATQRRKKENTRAREAPGLPEGNSGGLRPQHGGLRPRAFAVNGVWISERKLLGLACHLATGPLRLAHQPGQLVQWRFPHARNMAFRALVAGHTCERIAAEYAAGVARSHADARDRGEARPREPSAAVAYTWRRLQDGANPGDRWVKIFAAPPGRRAFRKAAPVEDHNALMDNVQTPGNAAVNSAAPHGAATRSAPAAAARDPEVERRYQVLKNYLAGRGMSIAEFNGLNWAWQERLLAAAEGGAGQGGADPAGPAAGRRG